MPVVRNIEELMRDKKDEMENDPSFKKLKEYYDEMSSLGAIRSDKYSLPLRDTIGRDLYRIQVEANAEHALKISSKGL